MPDDICIKKAGWPLELVNIPDPTVTRPSKKPKATVLLTVTDPTIVAAVHEAPLFVLVKEHPKR